MGEILYGVAKEKAHEATLEIPVDDVQGMLDEEAKLEVLKQSVLNSPEPRDMRDLEPVFANGERVAGAAVSSNGGDVTQAAVVETKKGSASAETAKSGDGEAVPVSEVQSATLIVSTIPVAGNGNGTSDDGEKCSFQERAKLATIKDRAERDARVAAREAAQAEGFVTAPPRREVMRGQQFGKYGYWVLVGGLAALIIVVAIWI